MASPDIHMQKTSVYTRWRGAFVFFPRGTAYLRSSRRLARTARLAVVDNSLSIRGLYLRHRARRPRCFGRLSVNWRVPEKKLMFCPFYSCLVHLLFETVVPLLLSRFDTMSTMINQWHIGLDVVSNRLLIS